MASGCERHGRYYWCIKTTVSKSGEIYVDADEARILPDGTLSLVQTKEDAAASVNLALAPGKWTAVYAASVIDGSAVAVESWAGEVER